MNKEKWENKINKILYQESNMVQLFNYGNSTRTIDKITDSRLSSVLDIISNYKKIIICFDLEFQNTNFNLSDKNYVASDGSRSYSFIREFGLLAFIKKKSWYYIGNIILNFPNLTYLVDSNSIRYISLTYSSVTKNTEKIMAINDEMFKDSPKIIFETYPNTCNNNNLQELVLYQNKIYWDDPLVKERTLNLQQAKEFLNLFLSLSNKSIFVLKGQSDIKVIKNQYFSFFNIVKHNIFKNIYDIELFNGFSNFFFGRATLEKTFIGLTELPIYKQCAFFNKYISNLKAHNPVSDSFYTIVVAVIINLVLLDSIKLK